MTYIYVPPGLGSWPPAGQPVGAYDTYAELRGAAQAITHDGIPARDLTALSVKCPRSAGDRVALLLGVYAAVLAGLLLALDIAADGPLNPPLWGFVAAGLVVVAVGLAAVAAHFRRRARRFLEAFDPPLGWSIGPLSAVS